MVAKKHRTTERRVTRYGKLQLASFDDLDKRTAAAQRIVALRSQMMDDLGGEEQLSSIERTIIDRIALLQAILEDQEVGFITVGELDIDRYTKSLNSLVRAANAVGIERKPKNVTPSLSDYINGKAQRS